MPQAKRITDRVAAAALYLATVAVGMLDVYFIRELFFVIYARLSQDNAPALFWSDVIVVLAAIGFVVFAIVTGEYHRKHYGERRSWRLFVWTLAVGLALPLIVLLLGGSA